MPHVLVIPSSDTGLFLSLVPCSPPPVRFLPSSLRVLHTQADLVSDKCDLRDIIDNGSSDLTKESDYCGINSFTYVLGSQHVGRE